MVLLPPCSSTGYEPTGQPHAQLVSAPVPFQPPGQPPTFALSQRLPEQTDPSRPGLAAARCGLHGAVPRPSELRGEAAAGGGGGGGGSGGHRCAEAGRRERVLLAGGGDGFLVQTERLPVAADAQGEQAPRGGNPAASERAVG